jgi:hypothetical protein
LGLLWRERVRRRQLLAAKPRITAAEFLRGLESSALPLSLIRFVRTRDLLVREPRTVTVVESLLVTVERVTRYPPLRRMWLERRYLDRALSGELAPDFVEWCRRRGGRRAVLRLSSNPRAALDELARLLDDVRSRSTAAARPPAG